MKRLIAIVVVVFAVAVAMAGARPKKVKLSETVQYVGEAVKGVPTGEGTIYVNDRPSREPTVRGDVVTGTFDDNVITGAEVVFSSGWRFSGRVVYKAETLSKKPLQTVFQYDLSGTLTSPDLRKHFEVEHLIIKRQTDGEEGSLATESMCFDAKRKTLEGELADYVVNITVKEDLWTSTEGIRLAPAVFFKGKEVAVRPSGEGTLTIFASDDQTGAKTFDKLTGKFADGAVQGAAIEFSSGWKFSGEANYSVEVLYSDPYEVTVTYKLTGDLFDPSGKKITELRSTPVTRTVAPGSIYLKPFENYFSVVPDAATLKKYEAYIDDSGAFYPMTLTVEETRDGSWRTSTSYPSEVPVIWFKGGSTVKEYPDGFAVHNPVSDLEVRSGALVEFRREASPGAYICLSEPMQGIEYRTDSTSYIGSFEVAGVGLGRPVGGKEKALGEAFGTFTLLDEIPLMYIDGIVTHVGDTLAVWSSGVNGMWNENIPEERNNPFVGRWRERETNDSQNSLTRWSEVDFASDGTFSMEVSFRGEGSDWEDIRSTGAEVIIMTILKGTYDWNGKMMSRSFDEGEHTFDVVVEFSDDCTLSNEEREALGREMQEGVGLLAPSLEPLLGVYTASALKQIVLQNELALWLGLPGGVIEEYDRVLSPEQLADLRERREERRDCLRNSEEYMD